MYYFGGKLCTTQWDTILKHLCEIKIKWILFQDPWINFSNIRQDVDGDNSSNRLRSKERRIRKICSNRKCSKKPSFTWMVVVILLRSCSQPIWYTVIMTRAQIHCWLSVDKFKQTCSNKHRVWLAGTIPFLLVGRLASGTRTVYRDC